MALDLLITNATIVNADGRVHGARAGFSES